MPKFKSWQSFSTFEWNVKRHTRYIRPPEMEEFLQSVLASSKKRKEKIPKGVNFWRSQLGHDFETIKQHGEEIDIPCPFSSERMKPVSHMAREGRANPKGIPYLYLSTDRDTAMAEVRPWIGSYISVGQFKVLKNLKLINCTVKQKKGFSFYFKEPSAKEKEEAVWAGIDSSFSKPVEPNDSIADYVSTQIIAELFKNNGYDGIAYKSSLGKGHNIVLFDLNAADLINCFLFEVKKVSLDFKETAQPYFKRKYYRKKRQEKSLTN